MRKLIEKLLEAFYPKRLAVVPVPAPTLIRRK